jgi:hypothetical protein
MMIEGSFGSSAKHEIELKSAVINRKERYKFMVECLQKYYMAIVMPVPNKRIDL